MSVTTRVLLNSCAFFQLVAFSLAVGHFIDRRKRFSYRFGKEQNALHSGDLFKYDTTFSA